MIHKLAMLKLYDSRIMSFVLAEAKIKGGKLGLQGTGEVTCPTGQSTRLTQKHGTIKRAVSRRSSSFCLILPITRPQSLWNLK